MTEETKQPEPNQGRFLRNVLIKGVLIFLVINFAVALIPTDNHLGRLSLYNRLWQGRVRLPFGENPREAYNLSLYDLDAMIASHEINAGPKPADEFRIILIGDSATWGTLLMPDETLSGLINQEGLTTTDGKTVRAFNLAYPSMSLMKDLMILELALDYDPDLIVWPVTLQSLPDKIQAETPLVANNPDRAMALIDLFDMSLEVESDDFVQPTFWDRTLIGRRRAILDALQLQFYGPMWAATGIDQTYPSDYTPAQRDFAADETDFMGWELGTLSADELAAGILDAGALLAPNTHILVVNEPILISQGENSDIRYNFFYPRWAYDQYRELLADRADMAGWQYVDLWDTVPQEAFTNSAVHLTPAGVQTYFEALKPALQAFIAP
jgi:hypothetical protein